ncbi:hypothetical protein [Alteromonas sp. ASW11-130]|uniref:hypothetical protein n=1 Tax=Alteromonas sp. ASW11-130 TaxID=3015775 RepID=UPI0022421C55|nr:hypothetical protein [Alteromonas sp. ASW11-130]MCW8092267.1 hypothetical protein [Alteromonas sp. ASW11-130]
MFTIIIILIVVLIVAAIFINAFQQHRAKLEAEERAEVVKQKAIIDETENVMMAASNMPISPRILQILQNRIVSALKVIRNTRQSTADIKQRISDAESRATALENTESLPVNDFSLPDNDKMIIQYIQGVKKLRIMLRSEHSKGRVDTKTFIEEDKNLERLQLKVNVETLTRRGRTAMNSGMLGSARQYFEKAIAALDAQTHPDDYVKSRLQTLREWLHEIQANLKNTNAEDRARKKEEERDELDELFAPKKKW